jgi:hypothetical protein
MDPASDQTVSGSKASQAPSKLTVIATALR